MNVAYFSTTTATGSSNSYSRFTCCGGLLMIDICFLLLSSLSLLDAGKTLRKQSVSLFAGLERPHEVLASRRQPNVGSLQPIPVSCPRPIRMSRHAQPLCSQQLRVTRRVTRTVTVRVICVFHAPVTVSSRHSERRNMRF